MTDRTEVLVIGGGPAGSTAAALLARAGRDVLLLEREVFPRYHIGESLLPSCVPVLELSGALERVRAEGFQVKRGGLFRWARDEWVIDWTRSGHPVGSAWHVDRARFDHLLLQNAAAQGATVVQGATVQRVIFDADRPVAVEWIHQDVPDVVRTTALSFLIDASGRAGVLAAQHFQIRARHTTFDNVAVWGYWSGTRLLPGGPEGAINLISAPNGWYWGIPLAGFRLSLGFVMHTRAFQADRPRFASLEAFYLDRVLRNESMRWMVENGIYIPGVRAEQDYSYIAARFCGPRHIIVGDAACFLDPLLSTGVHLATYSAFVGAAAISSILHGDVPEPDALAFFEHSYRRAYCRLLVLISHLYQRYDGAQNYLWQAQRLHRPQGRTPLASFADISAGLTDVREAIDTGARILTDDLLMEAEAAQQASRQSRAFDLPGDDISPIWATWRADANGPDPLRDLYVVSTPRLGLRRGTA